MTMLTLRAYALLLSFESVIQRRDFARLYARVRNERVRRYVQPSPVSACVCEAIDRACAFYFTEVQCLQRSAATVCLFRQLGVSAELVIGAQPLPFRAHAWVEVEGAVVNDKLSATETYAVLDRC
jgi:hypothetical protein